MEPTIQTVNVARLSSGDQLALQVYQFIGKQNGEKVYIQANLHGAEIVGNVVINYLFNWLLQLDPAQLAGEIWLVPACNPLGMNERAHFFSPGRFNSYDGTDWNRIFWDYDQNRDQSLDYFAKHYLQAPTSTIYEDYLKQMTEAFQTQKQLKQSWSGVPYWWHYRNCLQSLCLDATEVIDIHSSSNQGINFFFAFPGRRNQARALLLDTAIFVEQPQGDTFDEAFIKPWLSLENAFAKLGRHLTFNVASWTLELGNGMTAHQQSVTKGVKGIKNYLAHQGIVEVADFPVLETENHEINWVYKNQIKKYYAPTGGIIQSYPQLNQKIVSGEPIYEILQFQQTKPAVIEVKAEQAGIISDIGTNQAVNEGEYVLTVLEQ